ncbi:MAG: CAP domain-containing protein [Actinobacteria bacterium]|nr:CAP domain-containing protein [Actinomycetota bacterium]
MRNMPVGRRAIAACVWLMVLTVTASLMLGQSRARAVPNEVAGPPMTTLPQGSTDHVGSVRLKLSGPRLGSSVRVVLKGVGGRARDSSRHAYVRSASTMKELRRGTYRVRVGTIRSDGSVAEARSIRPRLVKVGAWNTPRVRVTMRRVTAGSARTAGMDRFEAKVLTLTNQARARGASCGGRWFAPAKPLRADADLARVARSHSRYMAAGDRLSHTGRGGSSPFDRLAAAGLRYRSSGENVAAGYPTPGSVVRGWLRSSGHCANMLSAGFTVMGVGYAAGDRGYRHYWTQTFMRPR